MAGRGARSASQAGSSALASRTNWRPSNQPLPSSRAIQLPSATWGRASQPSPSGVIQRTTVTGPSCTRSAGNSTRSRACQRAVPSAPRSSSQAPSLSTNTSARARRRPVAVVQQLGIQLPGCWPSIAELVWPCRNLPVSGPSRRIKQPACSLRHGPLGCQPQGSELMSLLGPRRWQPPRPAETSYAARARQPSSPLSPPPGDPRLSLPGSLCSQPPAAAARPLGKSRRW